VEGEEGRLRELEQWRVTPCPHTGQLFRCAKCLAALLASEREALEIRVKRQAENLDFLYESTVQLRARVEALEAELRRVNGACDFQEKEIGCLRAKKDALERELQRTKWFHDESDHQHCFHDQASGASCANDAHYRSATLDDFNTQYRATLERERAAHQEEIGKLLKVKEAAISLLITNVTIPDENGTDG
jgi:chromosome segregation ATPase